MASANGGRAEAERWLGIAEKLLATNDLPGSRTFAIRARESDPSLEASDRILAVVDTLLAAADRINDLHDWYAILGLSHRAQDPRAISAHYERLASLLAPAANSLPFADQAFHLASDAFSVLSNPAKRSAYDREVTHFSGSTTPDSRRPIPPPQPQPQPQPVRKSPRVNRSNKPADVSAPSSADPAQPNAPPSFWTVCPYCFSLFEYPKVYEECSMRCQKCRRAFQAVSVTPPPSRVKTGTGKDSYFCCWGFFPLGFNSESARKGNGVSNWSPFSPMFVCPSPPAAGGNERPNVAPSVQIPEATRMVQKQKNVNVVAAADRRVPRGRVCVGEEEVDDDAVLDVSDPSEDSDDDDDWNASDSGRKKKRRKIAKGKVSGGRSVRGRKGNNQSGVVEVKRTGGEAFGVGIEVHEGGGSVNVSKLEKGKKVPVAVSNSKRLTGKAAKDLGKLDLNVEFSNEVEEPTGPTLEMGGGNGTTVRNGEEDGIEGIGFFEGLDEFLSNLPILKTAE